jgi:hypothetical protein
VSVVVHFGPKKERGGVTGGGIEKCLSLAPQRRGVLESISGASDRKSEGGRLVSNERISGVPKFMKNSHTSSLRNR